MKKAMISQPMRGLTEEEILETKTRITAELEAKGYIVINTYFKDLMELTKDKLHQPVYMLGASLQAMSEVDLMYFAKGYEEARGCKFEHDIAIAYGIDVDYE